MRAKIIFPLLIAAFSMAAIVYWAFDTGFVRFNYPSSQSFPVQGIDISHHQGAVDWTKLVQSDVKFVYIKATEGSDFKDPKFFENWENAKKSGIARGAYHFFTFCKPGREQARNFLTAVPFSSGSLPPAIDLEFGGNCSKQLSTDEIAIEVKDFITEMQKVYTQKPIFYVTPEFYKQYLKNDSNKFPPHYLWVRNIFYQPRQDECEKWSFWQFANRGHIDGIEKPVDLNVFCAGSGKFQDFLQ